MAHLHPRTTFCATNCARLMQWPQLHPINPNLLHPAPPPLQAQYLDKGRVQELGWVVLNVRGERRHDVREHLWPHANVHLRGWGQGQD